MTTESYGTASRAERSRNTVKAKRYGLRALTASLLLPLMLGPWATGRLFSKVCPESCSYSEYTTIANIAQWSGFIAALTCLVFVIAYATESIARQEKKAKAIIAPAIAGLFTAFFAFGAFDFLAWKIIIRFFG